MLKITLPVGGISLAGNTTWVHFGPDMRISLDCFHKLATWLMEDWEWQYKRFDLEYENSGIIFEIGGHDSAQHGRNYLDPGTVMISRHNSGFHVETVNCLCRDYQAMMRNWQFEIFDPIRYHEMASRYAAEDDAANFANSVD